MSLQEIDVNMAKTTLVWYMCSYNREDMLLDVLLRPEFDLEHLGKCKALGGNKPTTPQEIARKMGYEGLAKIVDDELLRRARGQGKGRYDTC